MRGKGKQATLGDGYGCLGGQFLWYHGVVVSIGWSI